MNIGTIGWTGLARNVHTPQSGHSYFKGSRKRLIELVRANWKYRKPGFGQKDRRNIVVVPIMGDEKGPRTKDFIDKNFVCGLVGLSNATALHAKVTSRPSGRMGEERHVVVTAEGERLMSLFASVVLYHDRMLEKDEKDGDFDWHIVAVLVSPWDNEPVRPLTMARNFLKKEGGTFVNYTAQQFAEAIWFWKDYVGAHPKTSAKKRSRRV